VFATGSANFGYPDYPTAPTGPISREITYTNVGDAPVTLALATSLDLITLSAKQVAVPAHGSVDQRITRAFGLR
jgi:hypothetical protein